MKYDPCYCCGEGPNPCLEPPVTAPFTTPIITINASGSGGAQVYTQQYIVPANYTQDQVTVRFNFVNGSNCNMGYTVNIRVVTRVREFPGDPPGTCTPGEVIYNNSNVLFIPFIGYRNWNVLCRGQSQGVQNFTAQVGTLGYHRCCVHEVQVSYTSYQFCGNTRNCAFSYINHSHSQTTTPSVGENPQGSNALSYGPYCEGIQERHHEIPRIQLTVSPWTGGPNFVRPYLKITAMSVPGGCQTYRCDRPNAFTPSPCRTALPCYPVPGVNPFSPDLCPSPGQPAVGQKFTGNLIGRGGGFQQYDFYPVSYATNPLPADYWTGNLCCSPLVMTYEWGYEGG